MKATQVNAVVDDDGLWINGMLIDKKQPLEHYRPALGGPSRTIDAGPPAPVGHRNNQVHVFDSLGIYLTEHHGSRLIESVNFVFDSSHSPFPIENPYDGEVEVKGQRLRANLEESPIDTTRFARDLPGEYSVKHNNCWVGIFSKEGRGTGEKRGEPLYIFRVSVCFDSRG